MRLKDYANLKEMLIDFNEYSTDYTKTRCKELEETIENTLKEIERLHSIIKEVREYIENNNIYSNKKIDDVLEILNKGSDKEC